MTNLSEEMARKPMCHTMHVGQNVGAMRSAPGEELKLCGLTDQAISPHCGARVKRHPNERDPGGHEFQLENRRRHFIQRLAVIRHYDLDAGRPARAV